MLTQYQIENYLKKQKLNFWEIELRENQLFNNIIVIPAIDELENIPKLLDSLSSNSKKYLLDTLVLVVVNNTASTKRQIIEQNLKLLKYLRSYQKDDSSLNLGIIDAVSKGKEMPEKFGGVGLARKIGADLALKLFDFSNNEKKILIYLDADCLVSSNYLQAIVEKFNNMNLHAAVINFEHPFPEEKTNLTAIINYEIFLRYYILGLLYAESHYSHLSVGSTIICDAESYIRVGGMNMKKAGEDFYFLEKLAKNNKIKKVADATVYPSARPSNRVPFGTGARIQKFIPNNSNEYLLYSPDCFEILKKWLTAYNQKITLSTSQRDLSIILEEMKEMSLALFSFLEHIDFVESWERIINNTKTDQQLNKQKINWMDGFRTLKLIHHLRDNQFPNEYMFPAINSLLNKMNLDFELITEEKIPPLKVQLEYLKLLRKIT